MPLDERFDIGAAIHVGQVATAYEAVQRGLDRKVLLKVIHPQWKNDPELLERFNREGKAAAKVSHHNVVKIFDHGWDNGLPYIVLEWIDGGSLASKLEDGPLPQVEVKKIAIELLKGLGAVHKAHLLHRDVKPDNIMLGEDGEARLTDFSLAGLAHISTLTGHDALIGSPAYMAPELLHGSTPDPRTDLYSLGVVLFEVLTGSNPFQADNPLASLARIEKIVPTRLTGKPRLDPQLAVLIDSLLEKDPNLRPSNTDVALRLLDQPLQLSEPGSVAPLQKVVESRSLYSYSLVALVAGIAIILIVTTSELATYTAPKAKIYSPANPPVLVTPSSDLKEPVSDTLGYLPITGKSIETNAGIIKQGGTLILRVNPWGNVSIDGKLVGTTPLGQLTLSAGRHEILITHPQLPSVRREIFLEPEEKLTVSIDLQLETGSISVTAVPWGYLWIDDDSIGLLPRTDPVWAISGKHRVKVTHPEISEASDSIWIEAGKSINVKVNLVDGTVIATPFDKGD